ncbi:hypothetical protein [Tropicibacter alexandrii]|uniref:hypothetical protein n=1 Tax=Tropicibacter alexandrii TaxID=2267683 RepID=UPI00100897E3|nr:hypothetical protein [Tropicibacter alexandrii]
MSYTESLEVALQRLGNYLDSEFDTLQRVLILIGQTGVEDHLSILSQLHLSPQNTAITLYRLLDEACLRLKTLQQVVNAIPNRAPLDVANGPADFDAMVRWSASRLQDIISTIQHALQH